MHKELEENHFIFWLKVVSSAYIVLYIESFSNFKITFRLPTIFCLETFLIRFKSVKLLIMFAVEGPVCKSYYCVRYAILCRFIFYVYFPSFKTNKYFINDYFSPIV